MWMMLIDALQTLEGEVIDQTAYEVSPDGIIIFPE